jgi:hypothetical protein
MKIVPVSSVPSQVLNVSLSGQECTIEIYQKDNGLFADIYLSGSPISTSTVIHDRTRLVRYPYLKFIGDLMVMDTLTNIDPEYTGLGTRFVLCYLEPGIDV